MAILIEAIWENLKIIWQDGKVNLNQIGVLVLSIIISLLTGIDIFSTFGIIMQIPYASSILTGIIASRGANFIHDLMKKINSIKGE